MISTILIASAILWVFWIAMSYVLTVTRNEDDYNIFIVILSKAFGFGFIFFIDIPYNILFGSIMFVELPSFKRLTLTARLQRILAEEDMDSWRWKFAYFLCRYFISPWDFNHCRIGLGG